MEDDRQPQSAGSIAEKAIEIFRRHVQIAENYQQWDALPVTYEINDVYLWIDIENGTVSIENPYLFNTKNPKHIEAIEIAQEIYTELACLRGIFFFCENGEINEEVFCRYEGFSEDAVFENWEYVQLIPQNPYYQSAPHGYRKQIDAVIVKYAEYIIAFPKHQKEKQLLAMRASSNHGFVYLIQSPTGSYKIGRTKDPDNRMKTFSVKLPFEVDYVCVIELADMYELERDLHKKYASKRVNGEWFCLDPEDVEYIKSLAVQS